jgi:hypothetical protein
MHRNSHAARLQKVFNSKFAVLRRSVEGERILTNLPNADVFFWEGGGGHFSEVPTVADGRGVGVKIGKICQHLKWMVPSVELPTICRISDHAAILKYFHQLQLMYIEPKNDHLEEIGARPERIYNPITAMGFSAMFPFSWTTLRGKHCRHPIAVMGVVDTFRVEEFSWT